VLSGVGPVWSGKDEQFNGHWEVWRLVVEHGDSGRRTISSFCPFCLHNESLSSSKRISKTMNLLEESAKQIINLQI
jgi:hypothetical protein